MITLDTLNRWLAAPAESEHLEFKEAKQQFDPLSAILGLRVLKANPT